MKTALLALALSLSAATAHADCTRDDAFNKMMALNQYGMRLQAALPDPLKDPDGYNANYKKVMDFNTRLGNVGQTLADGKYGEACATYDALAKDYGVDYAAQAVRPLSAYEADAKAPPKAGCDIVEASKRSMWLTTAFQQHAEAKKLDREAWVTFGNETEPVGLAMQQDPAEACAMIDRIAAKYGLVRPNP